MRKNRLASGQPTILSNQAPGDELQLRKHFSYNAHGLLNLDHVHIRGSDG